MDIGAPPPASPAGLKPRAAAEPQDEATLRQVARQFEALLTQQVLKASKLGALGTDLMGSAGGDLYRDLFEQQMAQQISSKGLGLADVLVQQLRGAVGAGPVGTTPLRPLDARDVAAARPSIATRASEPETPGVGGHIERFVQQFWHHAEKAAKALGLPTEAVVGHAALETGWGAHQPGGDSHNFFGIKTGSRWQGEKASASTTEMDGGVTRREVADFRRYESADAGMADYVHFLKANPRYAAALKSGSAEGFAEGLQKAGYATDPAYAAKLKAAMARAAAARPAV